MQNIDARKEENFHYLFIDVKVFFLLVMLICSYSIHNPFFLFKVILCYIWSQRFLDHEIEFQVTEKMQLIF